MSLLEMLLLGVALAMDCFTVSITCGAIQKHMGHQVWVMAVLFGFFQGLMPFIGWGAADLLKGHIEAYDHWIAFGLLVALGVKMIIEGIDEGKKGEHTHLDPSKSWVIVTLAIATSIDALAVGFSFVAMGVHTYADISFAMLIIALISFIATLLGKYIGVNLGRRFNWPMEQIGGTILILIGIRVLCQHLLGI